MKVKYSKSALKFLADVQKKVADSIRKAIDGLKLTPPEGRHKNYAGI